MLLNSVQSTEDVFNYFEVSPQLSNAIIDHYKMFRDDPESFKQIFTEPVIHDYFKNLQRIAELPNITLAQKIQKIKNLEDTFDYSVYNEDIQGCLQVMSSVARYSLYLWAPTAQG